jgi:hypothetical protein
MLMKSGARAGLFVFLSCLPGLHASSQPSRMPKVCTLLSKSDLQAALGIASARVGGVDGTSMSTCTIATGNYMIHLRIQKIPPGTPAADPAARTKAAEQGLHQEGMQADVRDFGSTHCLRALPLRSDGPRTSTTSCWTIKDNDAVSIDVIANDASGAPPAEKIAPLAQTAASHLP